jgi:hypothetical protein
VGEGAVADRAAAGLAVLLGAVVVAPFALVAAAYAMTFRSAATPDPPPEPRLEDPEQPHSTAGSPPGEV